MNEQERRVYELQLQLAKLGFRTIGQYSSTARFSRLSLNPAEAAKLLDEMSKLKGEIMNIDDFSIDSLNREPFVSLIKARKEILDELHTEEVRHETVISVEIAKYEARLRTESDFHERRIAELEDLLDMLSQRIEGAGK